MQENRATTIALKRVKTNRVKIRMCLLKQPEIILDNEFNILKHQFYKSMYNTVD